MADYRLVIDVKRVAEGDVTTLAQDIWNDHAESFDAELGDFKLNLAKLSDGHAFDVDWTPAE